MAKSASVNAPLRLNQTRPYHLSFKHIRLWGQYASSKFTFLYFRQSQFIKYKNHTIQSLVHYQSNELQQMYNHAIYGSKGMWHVCELLVFSDVRAQLTKLNVSNNNNNNNDND